MMPDGEPITVAQRMQQVRETLRRLGPAAPLAVAVTVVPPIGSLVLITLATTTSMPHWMRDHPTTAIPAYIGAFWILGLFTLPTYAYSVLGGWAFGFKWGMIASCLAYAGAACGAFAIARWIARDRVLPLINEHPKIAAVHRALVGASFGRTLLLVALLRITPASPFAITNVVFGAGGISWLPFVVGTALGVLPRTAAVMWIASQMTELSFSSKDGWWLITLGVVATVVAIGFIGRLARNELDRQLVATKPASNTSPTT